MEDFKRDVLIDGVAQYFFGEDGRHLTLTTYQADFILKVIKREKRKFIYCGATRSGKTEATSVAAILLADTYANEKVAIIAPIYKQASILFGRIRSHLETHPALLNKINQDKSFTKEEVHFKNGSAIKCFSADNPESLLGFGATVLIVDEAASIDDDTYKTRIFRFIMAARGEEPIVILLSTPHHKNFFFGAWKDPTFEKIKVTWRMAVAEGQIREETVLEAKANMSEMQFKIWYEAEFAEDDEDALIQWKWIEAATTARTITEDYWIDIGVDVARMGNDLTVTTAVKVSKTDDYREVAEIDFLRKKDTMVTVGKVIEMYEKYKDKLRSIKVDEIGTGGGVLDRLKEQNYPAYGFVAGEKSPDQKFTNLKAFTSWIVREYFEKGKIKIPVHKSLMDELNKMKYEFASTGKIKIKDPTDKSPDYYDSLMIAFSSPQKTEMRILLDPDNLLGLG